MLWTSSIKSKATGMFLGTSSLGIHLHPALLIERRKDFDIYNHFPLMTSSSNSLTNDNSGSADNDDNDGSGSSLHQQQLYLREHCDAGTIVAVIPNTAAINLQNLRRRGVLSSSSFSGIKNNNTFVNKEQEEDCTTPAPPPPSADPFGQLIGAPSTDHWVELCWRLAIEVASSSSAGNVSPWWYWLDTNKKQQPLSLSSSNSSNSSNNSSSSSSSLFYHLEQRAIQEYRMKFPEIANDALESEETLRNAVLENSFEDKILKTMMTNSTKTKTSRETFPIIPSQSAWRFAMDSLLYKSVLSFDGVASTSTSTSTSASSSSLLVPSIIPIVDLCAHHAIAASSNKQQDRSMINYFEPNVVVTILEKDDDHDQDKSSRENKYDDNDGFLPEWVRDQKKQDIYLDAREERSSIEDLLYNDGNSSINKKMQKSRKGPRKPRITFKEKMELKMKLQQEQSSLKMMSNKRTKKRKASSSVGSKDDSSSSIINNNNPNPDFYFALELIKPLGPGEMLRLDWQELSPISMMMTMDENENENRESTSSSSHHLMMMNKYYSWMRYRVVPGV